MLRWYIVTIAQTISLPLHRATILKAILDFIQPNQRTILTKTWHKVIGELWSMSIALPGARGLFSPLQEAFRHKELHRPHVRLSKAIHEILQDFHCLAKDLSICPTRIAELVLSDPKIAGAREAAAGMGGVFFVPNTINSKVTPHLWPLSFPCHIQAQLVTFCNPSSTINNIMLELCGNIAQHDIIAQTADVRKCTIDMLSDNVTSIYWLQKGSPATTKPPACLLHI